MKAFLKNYGKTLLFFAVIGAFGLFDFFRLFGLFGVFDLLGEIFVIPLIVVHAGTSYFSIIYDSRS